MAQYQFSRLNSEHTFERESLIRELDLSEIDEVNGAWVMNALGALVGGVSTAAGVSMAGGGYGAIAAGFVGGAVGGAVNPISSVGSVFRTIGGGVGAGASAQFVTHQLTE